MNDAMPPAPKPAKVLGGALTRGSDGVLRTARMTSPGYPTPMIVQMIWSNVRQRSYPKAWDGVDPPAALTIFWREPTRFLCGKCGRSLGKYVAYHARPEYGIVADTAKRYVPRENFSERPGGSATRASPPGHRFRIDGEIGYRAARSTAHFHCPRCGYDPAPYNLARIGRLLFKSPRDSFRVGIDRVR